MEYLWREEMGGAERVGRTYTRRRMDFTE